jgi:uncharacterized protein (UPF0333 family)
MEGIMFDALHEEKQDTSTKMWIGLFVIVAVAALGVLYYVMTKDTTKEPAAAVATAAAAKAPSGPADPIHELKVQRVTMAKDPVGTTAVWSVTIENRSTGYAYSNIKYETTYLGANNKALVVNQGVITNSIGPGEQVSPEVRDVLYPAGTMQYKFKITDAKATAQ